MSKDLKLIICIVALFWTLPVSGALAVEDFWLGFFIYLAQVPICITLLKAYKDADDTK